MATLENKSIKNEYQAVLDEAESITITINGSNEVFSLTVATGNKARISFRVEEALATSGLFPQA